MTFTLNGSVVDQTGTNTSLAGIEAIAGVTLTDFGNLRVYDMGTIRLNVEGTLTIAGDTDNAELETLLIGVNGATQNIDITIANGGTLIVGTLDAQGGVEFSQAQFWPAIIENAATDFGDGNGNISSDGGTGDAFLNVDGGGRLEWYGCINSTGGMRFKGANDGGSTDEAQVVIRGGVLDARRLTERGSGEADQFIYNYSDELDIQPPNGDVVGFTILSATTTGINEKGLAIIQLGEPIALQGYRPVFSSQAVGGSSSASIDLTYVLEDYTGIIGIVGPDNIDLRSASTASNTSIITFRNSVIGSGLNLATQDPGFDSIISDQTVTAQAVDATGADITDAVVVTFAKDRRAIQDNTPTAGAFALGNLQLANFTPPHTAPTADKPEPEFNGPKVDINDEWSFYIYSYIGENRNRQDVVLRGVGGTDIAFIVPIDGNVTETNRTTVDNYGDMRDLDRAYDRAKSFKIDNVQAPLPQLPIVTRAGTADDYGEFDITIDGTASNAFALSMLAAARDTIAQGLTWAQSTTATIAAGSHRLLVVAIGHENDPLRNVTSVTYGGVPLTLFHKAGTAQTDGGTNAVGIEAWGLLEAGISQAVGTTIVVVWDTTPTNNKVYRASFTNVSQVGSISGLDALGTELGEDALNQDPYAEDEGIVLGFSANGSAGTATWEAGATERLDTTTSGFGFSVADRFPTTDGEISMDVTSTEHLIMAVALRARQGLITLNPSTGISRIGATQTVVEAPEDDEITIAFPGGIEDDDVAYIFIGHAESEDNAWNTPSGWAVIIAELQTGGTPASIPGLTVFRRVLSSDSGNVVVDNAGTNISGIVGQMVVYRGVDTTTPEDATTTTATGTTGDPDPPSITPVNLGSMAIAVALGDTEQAVATGPTNYSNLLSTVTVDGGTEGDRSGSPSTDTYTTTGTTQWVVPAGVTEIEAKCWGAGAGGGGGGSSITGATGGGGGFAHATAISVTAGETLDIIVGAGGGLGATGGAAEGGGGGGRTRIERQTGSVNLIEAGAGGGGGGGDNSGGAAATGRGGAGGGATGEAGVGSGTSTGGGGGTTSGGGGGGTGNEPGTAGAAGVGGDGGDDDGTAGGTANGGAVGGGEGGNTSAGFGAGGGGGAGRFGGGGGGSAQATVGSGTGGGGGSNLLTGTTQSNAQGTAGTGAGQGDGDYPANTGDGGGGGAISTNGVAGERGAVVVIYTAGGTSLDGCTMSTADRLLTTTSPENPGTFNFDQSEEWATATLVLRQAAGGSAALQATSNADTVNTIGTVRVANGAQINGLTINADVVLEDVVNLTDVTINGDLTIETAGTYTFSNVTVTGDTTNSDASGNVTINATGGSLTTSEPGTGNGLVNIVESVTVTITCVDNDTKLPIEGVNVILGTGPGLTDVIDNILTNASGVVSTTYGGGTPDNVEGFAAKGSEAPVYRRAPISGTVVAGTGFGTIVAMVTDA